MTRSDRDLRGKAVWSVDGQPYVPRTALHLSLPRPVNQPLMAIRSFAENAKSYLERGKTDVAGQNLGRIAELARRVGRIIRNLRSFAKQESEGMTDVDLSNAITAVLEITQARANTTGIEFVWDAVARMFGGQQRCQMLCAGFP